MGTVAHVEIQGDRLAHLRELYDRGRFVDAFVEATTWAPLRQWTGAEACVLASRIAAQIGAPGLSLRLAVQAKKEEPDNPDVIVHFGYQLLNHRGALTLWEAVHKVQPKEEWSKTQQAEYWVLHAWVACDLRDFLSAEDALAKAKALDPNRPWVHLARTKMFEQSDRVEEALAAAQTALHLHAFPFYCPAVQMTANLLHLLGRSEEALRLLGDADAVVQSEGIAAQRYALLCDTERWSDAQTALERVIALSPLNERWRQLWITSQRTHVLYRLGFRAEAAQLAREIHDPFHQAFAIKLEEPPAENERHTLHVAFYRQKYKTCAPATFVSLSRYWHHPIDHDSLMEEICYDGTPAWQQRKWAERHGWLVREFRVTYENAMGLILKGIPFAITTTEARSAHMQAVVGFDRTRGTLLLRDPSNPFWVTVPAESFLQRYRAFGPHGMVFLPPDEKSRLGDVILDDEAPYDAWYRICLALNKHARESAEQQVREMEKAFPAHALTWEAALQLAYYDANVEKQAQCLDALLAMFPNNAARILMRLQCLCHAPREERIAFMERACSEKKAEPELFVELARTLEGDARSASQAQQALRRAKRHRATDPALIQVQADCTWAARLFEEATELYRFAANLDTYDEARYQTWFSACRSTRRSKEALAYLQERWHRFGTRSELPALTLAWALQELEHPEQAQEVLEEARQSHPESGNLLLRLANLSAQIGDKAQAEAMLTAARETTQVTSWLRSAAGVAETLLDSAAALNFFRQLIALEPLALDAHAGFVRNVSRLEGAETARSHLQAVCKRFPFHCGLRRMWVEWCRSSDSETAERAVRSLLALTPSDAWAHRELALTLSRSKKHGEALEAASEAACIEPGNTICFSVLGSVCRAGGKNAEAHNHFRRAVELSADNTTAQEALLELAHSDVARKDELRFIERQLVRQVVTGDGILEFLGLARPVLSAEELLSDIQQACVARPDLWQAASAHISQLGHMGRLDEALSCAKEATRTFPHVPRLWLDLALVHQWREETDAEREAAEHAFETNPSWTHAALALTDVLKRQGAFDEALHVFARALQHNPQDSQLHTGRAQMFWLLRQTDEAFKAVEKALTYAPDYEWAWDRLSSWSTECGQADKPVSLARALTRERPGEPGVWVQLARLLMSPSHADEGLAAIGQALTLDPRKMEIWDFKALLLVTAERFDEAIRVCKEGAETCNVDAYCLKGRWAWIEAQRNNAQEAITLMRTVLAENVNYAWGWTQLARWLTNKRDFDAATEAFEHVRRLYPHDAWPLRQLGNLCLEQGNLTGAKKAFSEAFRRDPSDKVAAHKLLELHRKFGEKEAAVQVVELMRAHQPGAATCAAEAMLYVQQNERMKAVNLFRQLCLLRNPDGGPIDAVADAFQQKGWGRTAIRILKQALKAPAHHPQTAAAAIRLLTARRRGFRAVLLFLRLQDGEAQKKAAVVLVNGLADLKQELFFNWLLWRRHEVLQREDDAWGETGRAFIVFNRHKAVARWMGDWKSRPNVEPWMLFNLCLSLRHLGRYDQAFDTARYTVETWGHRDGATRLSLFLAIEEALLGHVKNADEYAQQATSICRTIDYDKDLLTLAKGLVDFLSLEETERALGFISVGEYMATRFTPGHMLFLDKDVRRTFRRAKPVFLSNGGGWRARVWFGWRLHWFWLLVPVIFLLGVSKLLPMAIFMAVIIRWLSLKK